MEKKLHQKNMKSIECRIFYPSIKEEVLKAAHPKIFKILKDFLDMLKEFWFSILTWAFRIVLWAICFDFALILHFCVFSQMCFFVCQSPRCCPLPLFHILSFSTKTPAWSRWSNCDDIRGASPLRGRMELFLPPKRKKRPVDNKNTLS